MAKRCKKKNSKSIYNNVMKNLSKSGGSSITNKIMTGIKKKPKVV